jgi:hypothetical protein
MLFEAISIRLWASQSVFLTSILSLVSFSVLREDWLFRRLFHQIFVCILSLASRSHIPSYSSLFDFTVLRMLYDRYRPDILILPTSKPFSEYFLFRHFGIQSRHKRPRFTLIQNWQVLCRECRSSAFREVHVRQRFSIWIVQRVSRIPPPLISPPT